MESRARFPQLASKSFIKALLKKHGLRPSKRLGQHFLVDPGPLKKIVSAADIRKQDVVLEIGPGLGVLTRELAEKAGKVIAVEKDHKMVEILKETLKEFDNVEIVQGDILDNFQFSIFNFQTIFNFQSISNFPHRRTSGSLRGRQFPNKFPNKYKLVANLPYYIAAPVIRKFLEAENPPKEMVLMVQKEVAQRICARPHRYAKRCGWARPGKMSLLAVSVQFYAKPEIMAGVSKRAFWPQPKVDGAIIKLKVQSSKFKVNKVNKDLFFRIVKAGFSHPRKQLVNNLSAGLKIDKEKVRIWLLQNNIQPAQRAQTLSVENWAQLAKTFVVKWNNDIKGS